MAIELVSHTSDVSCTSQAVRLPETWCEQPSVELVAALALSRSLVDTLIVEWRCAA